jgi:hypothetical protein
MILDMNIQVTGRIEWPPREEDVELARLHGVGSCSL